jgi:hypothetical protein
MTIVLEFAQAGLANPSAADHPAPIRGREREREREVALTRRRSKTASH